MNRIQLAQLRPHLMKKEWNEEKENLTNFAKETLLIALEVLQTDTLPFMTPEQTMALFELFDYCGIVRDDLNALIVKTPPILSEEMLEKVTWDELMEYLDPFVKNGQYKFRAGKKAYSTRWIRGNRKNLEQLGGPAILATNFLENYSLEDISKEFISLELLSFKVLMHLYKLDPTEIGPVLEWKKEVEFGNEDLLSSTDTYWNDIRQLLNQYPNAQKITLAGSSIQWSRAEVEAFVACGKITKEDLNGAIKII